MTDGNPAHALAEGLEALGLDLPPRACEQLLAFLRILAEWNRAYNLTAVRDPLDMVRRHLLDSLTLLPHLRGERIVDLGSGAGLPGIPLAIADPDRQFILLESNGKKVRFMRHAISQLGLSRVTVVQGRAESVQLNPPPDTVVARAVADLATLCGYARQLGAPGVWLVAMKGPDVAAELVGVPADFAVRAVLPVVVPGLEAARHLVCLRLMNGESD
jgi:16S rRNA (guanine527-N7)-methyltransferase